MLNSFRTFSGSIGSKIMLALLIAAFAAWGIEDIVRSPGRGAPVATVGKLSITQERYMRTLQNETETLRRIMGSNYTPETAKAMQLPARVLQRLVRHDLLQLENESLGLLPDDTDVVRRIHQNPNFLDKKGNFDKVQFQKMLRNAGLTEKAYVESLRQDITADILIDALMTPLTPSANAVLALYNAREERRIASLYTLTPAMVPNLPAPDQAALESYYKEHAQEFTTPEYRALSYVVLGPKDAPTVAAPSKEALEAAYQERIEELRRPERRQVEQLLFSEEAGAKKVYQQLTQGASFSQMSQSEDVLNKDAISLGLVDRSAVLDVAADSVFALRSGGFTAPIKSPFGWHIFRVGKIEAPSVMPFEEARPALEKELKQRLGDDAMTGTANSMEDMLAGGSTLSEVAATLKLKMVTVPAVTRSGKTADGSQPQTLPAYEKFLETAFKTDEKSESQLVSIKGGGYYVVRVEKITPEHLRPLEEVRSTVVSGWQKQERVRRLGDLSRSIATAFATPATRTSSIEQYGLEATSTGALKRSNAASQHLPVAMLQELFTRTTGDSTNAYPSENGNFVIAVVGSIIPAPAPEASALAEMRKKLAADMQNEIVEEYMNYLEQKFSVSINESVLDALLRE